MILDYEQLVVKFEENLLHTLRSHGVDLEYLAMWVPDENPIKGILNMVEAAQAASENEIAITVALATLPVERLASLEQSLAELGDTSLKTEAGRTLVRVTNLQDWAAFQNVIPPLREAVRLHFKTLNHENSLSVPGTASFHAEDDGHILAVSCDDGGVILQACHGGGSLASRRAILDAFCAQIEGLPLLEACEHGVIRVVHALRDPAKPWPVKGIPHPRVCDPTFAVIERLIRKILALQGRPSEINTFNDAPAADWLGAGNADRLADIGSACRSFLAERGLPEDTLAVLRLENDLLQYPVRVFLSFDETFPHRDKPSLIRAVEAYLRKDVEVKLQVFHEILKDQSGVRRL